MKCYYPECECPVAFVGGAKPSVATECPLAEEACREAHRILELWKQGRKRRLSTGPQLRTFIVRDGGRIGKDGKDGLYEEIATALMKFRMEG